jgi:PEP-CTERM motif
MKTYFTAAVLAGALAASPAYAANFIDQNTSPDTVYLLPLIPGLGQSFQPNATNVSGAGIFLSEYFGSGLSNITISLWTALPNASNAVMLASATGQTSTNNRWIDVFWTPATVTSGKTYYLRFAEDRGQYAISGDGGNDPLLPAKTSAIFGSSLMRGFNFAYRTYSNDGRPSISAVAAVPEPATWAMMLAGFGVVGFALRRRQSVRVTYA